jgi:hypothetical protein
VSDERRRGRGDTRRILALRPGNPGNLLVTTPLGPALTLASGTPEAVDGAVEVAR